MLHRTVLVAFIAVLLFPLLANAQLLEFEPISTTLTRPVAITNAGDGSGRLFIVQQDGQILIYDGVQMLATPFLDINTKVECCGERGLLSLAFHPEYGQPASPSKDYFYVYYTQKTTGDVIIARYTTTGNANVADPNSELVLLNIEHSLRPNHNGGDLHFSPIDNFLYATVGDGGGGGDPDENGQSLNSHLGKVLRFNVDIAAPYIPASNPYQGDGDPNTLGLIWSYGLRNPWHFSFDRLTGDILIGDVGQGCYEEVNFRPASSNGAENYGWDVMEGKKCFDEPSGNNCNLAPICNMTGLTSPVIAYSHSLPGVAAVTGGYVYRGTSMPQHYGRYIFADYGSGQIWGATPGGANWFFSELASTGDFIPAFGEDEAGELYYASIGFTPGTGAVYKIQAPPTAPYADDFEDNNPSDWIPLKGVWDAPAGALRGVATKKATIVSPYAGCSICTIETDLQIDTPGGRASVIGWYLGKKDLVELIVMEDRDRIVFKQISGGFGVFREKVTMQIDPGVNYHFALSFDGTDFQVFLNGDGTPLFTVPAGAPPGGTVGFRVKSVSQSQVTAIFESVNVY